MSEKHTSPLRYPGGKGTLADFMKLIVWQNNLADGHYVEVYAGGAAIAWELLFEEYVQKVHLNDINTPLIAFWKSVVEETDKLCQLIVDTPVNMETWYHQKSVQKNPREYSQLDLGFSTFFLNRTNRSGILGGGVIGGKNQTGKWKIDARFNKENLVARIERIARYSKRINIYNLDAAQFIRTALPNLPRRTLVYLDPPYFIKGQKLYENHYASDDHADISKLVATIPQPWLVSYDGCDEVRRLYTDFQHLDYQIRYSAQARYDGSEVIFFSPNLTIPQVQTPTSVSLTKPLL